MLCTVGDALQSEDTPQGWLLARSAHGGEGSGSYRHVDEGSVT